MTTSHGHVLISSADGQMSVDVTRMESFTIAVGAAATLTGGGGDDNLYSGSTSDGSARRWPAAAVTTRWRAAAATTPWPAAAARTSTSFSAASSTTRDAASSSSTRRTSRSAVGASVFADNLGGHDTVSGFEGVEDLHHHKPGERHRHRLSRR